MDWLDACLVCPEAQYLVAQSTAYLYDSSDFSGG